MIGLLDQGDGMPKGGKREGAGRKAAHEAGASVVFSARIPPDLDAAVADFLQRRGIGKADLLTTALRAYLESNDAAKS